MLASGGVLKLMAVGLLALSGSPERPHSQGYEGTHSPHGNLATPCQNCHTSNAWRPIRAVPEFDHNQTRYPLRGMHQSVTCTQCHVKMVFTNVGQRCQDCHADIHKRQLGANCEQCHTVRGWTVSITQVQEHNNRFPLTGAHAAVDCDSCHKGAANSKFQTMSTACYSCHAADFKSTSNPNHISAQFSTTCNQCHGTDNWLNAAFDHSTVGFPLTNAHADPPRQCADCHINNNYNLNTTACVSCHLKDFQGTTNPNHVTASFPQTCEQCHNTTSWLNASFNHDTTGFSLTGLHTVPPRQCTDCHNAKFGNYNITSTACVTCHLTDFQGTTNPNHVISNFPQTCEQCHNTTSWLNATFNHSSTGFPLTGSHTVPPRQCTDCHINNNYNLTTTACVNCHQTDYNNATTPVPHTGFPTTCETCHDTVQWTDGTFNHATTGFALTGSHTVPPRQCSDCHNSKFGNYNITSTACVNCHLPDYTGTTNPAHAAAGFPQQCELCHDTNVWTDSTFNHNTTAFPLTGSHTVPPRQCTDCHVNNNYTTLPLTCIGCHQTDYNNTSNPGHAAQPQFFPTTCQSCHSTTNWLNANFNHGQYSPFPTNHGGANNLCSTCHTNSNDYSVFQCTGCHGGNNANNFHHDNVSGYVYNSINCYQCHQSGNGGG